MIENEPDPLRRIPVKPVAGIRAEIGSALLAARQKKGLSLEAVAQQTRIPKRYLDAFENDRFDEFPALVYLRGFLKSYCDFLEVPFDALWAQIEGPRTAAPETAPAPAEAPAPAAAAPAAEPGTPAASALPAVIFAVLLALGVAIWLFHARSAPPAAAPAPVPKALLPVTRGAPPQVVLSAAADAWVRVAVDGKVVFEGRLPRGASMDWTPSREVVLRTTDPSSLRVTVGGKPRALPPAPPGGEYRIETR